MTTACSQLRRVRTSLKSAIVYRSHAYSALTTKWVAESSGWRSDDCDLGGLTFCVYVYSMAEVRMEVWKPRVKIAR